MSHPDDPGRVATARLVAEHRDAVWRFCRMIAPDSVMAEDVLQDTFLAALRHAGGIHGSPRAWLLTVARNALHRRLRRRVGEPAAFESTDQVDDLPGLGLAAGWGDPEAALRSAEDARLVRGAIGRLADPDREILALVDLEGVSQEAAANILAIPIGTVKARTHRARLRLMAVIREEVAHAG